MHAVQIVRLGKNPLVQAFTAPVLLALSFPPFNLSFLQFPALLLLLRICMITDSNRRLVFYAYPSLVLWNLLSTYWLMMATVPGGAAAILANAALMLIPLLLIRALLRTELHSIVLSFFSASIWVSYEFLHHNWDLSWPWLTLGNGWANLPALIQYISYTGVLGISFWVVFTSALLFSGIFNGEKKILVTGAGVFLAFPLISLFLWSATGDRNQDGDPVQVTIVQPNSDSYSRFGGMPSLDALLEQLLQLSDEARTPETDFILWPENAVDSSLPADSPYFARIRDSLDVWGTGLITGTGLVDFFPALREQPPVVRQTRNGRHYLVYNAALQFQPGNETGIYRKGKLVPVVERFPFLNIFASLDRFGWVNWGEVMGYGQGTTAEVFEINGARTPALICYDSVFPGWVNRFVTNGANFLAIITNDGWWGESHGHIQHFAFARLRAIEQRMWIARAANNGISGIISPDGNVQRFTEYGTRDAFTDTIYTNDNRTFFSRYGRSMGYLNLALTGLAVVLLLRKEKEISGET